MKINELLNAPARSALARPDKDEWAVDRAKAAPGRKRMDMASLGPSAQPQRYVIYRVIVMFLRTGLVTYRPRFLRSCPSAQDAPCGVRTRGRPARTAGRMGPSAAGPVHEPHHPGARDVPVAAGGRPLHPPDHPVRSRGRRPQGRVRHVAHYRIRVRIRIRSAVQKPIRRSVRCGPSAGPPSARTPGAPHRLGEARQAADARQALLLPQARTSRPHPVPIPSALTTCPRPLYCRTR